MKKFLMCSLAFSLAITVFTGTASAIPACSTALLTASPTSACDVGDVEFSGFGALPTGVDLQFQFSGPTSVSVNLYDATSTGLANGLTYTYNVQIDPAFANTNITTVASGLGDPTAKAVGKLTKTLTGGLTGTVTSTDNGAGVITSTVVNGSTAALIGVSDSLAVTSGDISYVANSFTYTTTSATPEPVSMVLFGSGLLAVSLIGRKKLISK
jgi:hypothetical protein